MNPISLSDSVAVGEAPQSDSDVRSLADADFQSIFNLETIDEDGEYPPRQEALDARQAGLFYLNYAIRDGELDDFHIAEFRTKLSMLPSPTYVHGAFAAKPAALSLIDHALQRHWSANRALDYARELGLPCCSEPWESLMSSHLGGDA